MSREIKIPQLRYFRRLRYKYNDARGGTWRKITIAQKYPLISSTLAHVNTADQFQNIIVPREKLDYFIMAFIKFSFIALDVVLLALDKWQRNTVWQIVPLAGI